MPFDVPLPERKPWVPCPNTLQRTGLRCIRESGHNGGCHYNSKNEPMARLNSALLAGGVGDIADIRFRLRRNYSNGTGSILSIEEGRTIENALAQAEKAHAAAAPNTGEYQGPIDVVFDGPPDVEAGRFVEVEDLHGNSVNVGEWIDRGDGTWALRLQPGRAPAAEGDEGRGATLSRMQAEIPWERPSQDEQRLHAALHIMKAAGKIAAVFEAEGHGGRPSEPTAAEMLPRMCADLVFCSLRLAQQQGFSLETATVSRIREKNPNSPFLVDSRQPAQQAPAGEGPEDPRAQKVIAYMTRERDRLWAELEAERKNREAACNALDSMKAAFNRVSVAKGACDAALEVSRREHAEASLWGEKVKDRLAEALDWIGRLLDTAETHAMQSSSRATRKQIEACLRWRDDLLGVKTEQTAAQQGGTEREAVVSAEDASAAGPSASITPPPGDAGRSPSFEDWHKANCPRHQRTGYSELCDGHHVWKEWAWSPSAAFAGHTCTEIWRSETRAPGRYRCKTCGCFWRLNPPSVPQPDGSWSLWNGNQRPDKCCDNAFMGEQIEPANDALNRARLALENCQAATVRMRGGMTTDDIRAALLGLEEAVLELVRG